MATDHSLLSSYREMLLEHLFAGEVMRHVWLSGVKRLEIVKPQVRRGCCITSQIFSPAPVSNVSYPWAGPLCAPLCGPGDIGPGPSHHQGQVAGPLAEGFDPHVGMVGVGNCARGRGGLVRPVSRSNATKRWPLDEKTNGTLSRLQAAYNLAWSGPCAGGRCSPWTRREERRRPSPPGESDPRSIRGHGAPGR